MLCQQNIFKAWQKFQEFWELYYFFTDNWSNIFHFSEPAINEVTQRIQLDRLAALYNLFIDTHVVPNILEEIYSTFQMLTVKEAKDRQSTGKEGNKKHD